MVRIVRKVGKRKNPVDFILYIFLHFICKISYYYNKFFFFICMNFVVRLRLGFYEQSIQVSIQMSRTEIIMPSTRLYGYDLDACACFYNITIYLARYAESI